MSRCRKIILTLAISLALVQTAVAGLVSNGDFETGNFSGWTLSSLETSAFVVQPAPPSPPGLGNWVATYGSTFFGNMAQTLVTIPDQTYELTFLLTSPFASMIPAYSFSVHWGGKQEMFINYPTILSYTPKTLTVVATDPTTSLEFTFLTPTGRWIIDDITVTAVPLPCTVVLLGSGFLGMAGWRRFRKG